ncbi:heavy metal-associated domain-containing protein, partial [Armatimonas sp.]|uniref:heavy metal-associated domain-containing protein n=1 Tax=Armatimonas sp. TaxID=1872638 RepID=UPI002869F3B9
MTAIQSPLKGELVSETTVDLAIQGMSCAACARRIEKQLSRAEGVQEAQVNYATHRARVSFNSLESSLPTLISVVQDTGFGASLLQRPEAALEAEEKAHAAEVKDLTRRFALSTILTI